MLIGIISLVDDFERALESLQRAEDKEAVLEGIELIHSKFINFLKQHGVNEIEAVGQPFGADRFEAVTTIPVEDEEQKGRWSTVSKRVCVERQDHPLPESNRGRVRWQRKEIIDVLDVPKSATAEEIKRLTGKRPFNTTRIRTRGTKRPRRSLRRRPRHTRC